MIEIKEFDQVLDRIRQLAPENYKFGKYNVERDSEIISRYQVMSVPTIIKYKSGSPVDQMVGARSFDAVHRFVINT